ncbi:hypothetical protein Ccrd_019143 [Cynara cardunculus var. scolymus]|uniref:Uncharacterized protein n=1 Tax=Cynara cardunculus var. scolymus TaxID=59895 RepID=A0A103Y4T6_CYNCS|nr:hypothetical protein Ccrd_019143 [Cynara cardunculus var. scolymus]
MCASPPRHIHLHRPHGRRQIPSIWPIRPWDTHLPPRVLRDSNCILFMEGCARVPFCSHPWLLRIVTVFLVPAIVVALAVFLFGCTYQVVYNFEIVFFPFVITFRNQRLQIRRNKAFRAYGRFFEFSG